MRLVRFSLKNGNDVKARQTINEIGTKYPVLVEISADRKMWELHGKKDAVGYALEVLQQRVKIKRETAARGITSIAEVPLVILATYPSILVER